MSTSTNEQMSNEEYSSSRHSTPNSLGGEKQFHFGSNNNLERYEKKKTNSFKFLSKNNFIYLEDQDKILEQVQLLTQQHLI